MSGHTRLYSDFGCDSLLENTSKFHNERELQQRSNEVHTDSEVGWNNCPLPDSQSLPYDRRGHDPHQGVHGQSRVTCKLAPLVYVSAKNRVSLWSKDDQTKTLADQSKNQRGSIDTTLAPRAGPQQLTVRFAPLETKPRGRARLRNSDEARVLSKMKH